MRTRSVISFLIVLLASLMATGCNADRAPTAGAAQEPKVASPPPLQISPVLPNGSALLVQKGERVATLLGCLGCHGKDLHGKTWVDEPEFAVLYSSNLTRAVSHYDDAQLERAIREGVRYDGSPLWEMPSDSFLHLSAPDMEALIAYLRSVPPGGTEYPRMVLGPVGKKEIQEGLLTPTTHAVARTRHIVPVFAGEENAWGRYLAQTICSECHGPALRGNPGADSSRPDLIAAASYSLDDFKNLLKTGQPTGNRKLGLMAKVSQSRFSHLTEPEVSAIHAYLVARAAVQR